MLPVQLKMARAALGLPIHQAAALTSVSHDTIVRIEGGGVLKPDTVDKVRSALEAAGVQFIAENGGGAGVQLAKPSAGDAE